MNRLSAWVVTACAALFVSGCGGGSGGGTGNPPPPTTYTISGTVTGLVGTGLVLQNNAGNNLTVAANGAFAFLSPVNSGAAYAVTVLTQPSAPAQVCAVTAGTGTAAANVTNVAVNCPPPTYTISGTVTGLSGTGLALQNNVGNTLAITNNGAFTFSTAVASGSAYSVTVSVQPTAPVETCAVTNGSGTASANVTNVGVACTIAVPTVTGLTQANAQSAITAAGLVVGTITQASSASVPTGSVIGQSPAAGTAVVPNTAVNLVVSVGNTLIAKAIAASQGDFGFTCAVTNTNAALCWGNNLYGQLGNASTVGVSAVPVQVSGLSTGVTAISGGDGFACAVVNSGVQCWGRNTKGQLGNGTIGTNSFIPVMVSGLSSGIAAVAAGDDFACAVTSASAVYCWGGNGNGQLGIGVTSVGSTTPVAVPTLASGVTALSASAQFACAIAIGGSARCWGDNSRGQLGNNSIVDSSTPVQVSNLTSAVTAISAGGTDGEQFTCAINSTGAAVCWGANNNYELGIGSKTPSLVPVQVTGLTSGVTSIAAGGFSACAVVSGSARCWGDNSDGPLGNNSIISSGVPVQVSGLTSGVVAVSAGVEYACALSASGAMHCWGANYVGQLGNGDTKNSAVPIAISTLTSGVTQIAGADAKCAVVSGAAQCWGDNQNGKVGNGTTGNFVPTPTAVTGLSVGVTAISSGNKNSCAVVSGAVKCWGGDFLGDGTFNPSAVPVQVSGLTTGATAVTTGTRGDGNVVFACAVVSGSAKCWGQNSYGQLGNSSTTLSLIPVQVSGLTTGVTQIAAGGRFTCAIVNGAAQCWGDNAHGQLGTNSTTSSLVPVQVTGLTSGVTAIASGGVNACAIHNGGVKCWGDNTFGQLGNGTTSNSLVPVSVTGLTTGMNIGPYAVGTGSFIGAACAVTAAGAVHCWGDNQVGELGNGSTVPYSTVPVPVTGLGSGITAVSGGIANCVISTSGGVQCWGANNAGELGNGTFGDALIPVQVVAGP